MRQGGAGWRVGARETLIGSRMEGRENGRSLTRRRIKGRGMEVVAVRGYSCWRGWLWLRGRRSWC